MMETCVKCIMALCMIGVISSALVEVIKTVLNIANAYLINFIVLGLNELLVIGSFVAYVQINNIPIVWYMVALAVLGGIFASGISLFGFDKWLKPLWERLAGIIGFFGN